MLLQYVVQRRRHWDIANSSQCFRFVELALGVGAAANSDDPLFKINIAPA